MFKINVIKKDSQQYLSDKGAVAVIVALSLIMLLGFGALAVDLGYRMIVKNELQNAADSGALAGAGDLYLADGSAVNPDANEVASRTALQNLSQKELVYIADDGIQRGHWSFSSNNFTPNDSLAPPDLSNSTEALDADTDFINAVRVRVRTLQPVASFLSRIWGGDPSYIEAVAVAYIGFAGKLAPGEADQPIAICMQSLTDPDGNLTCNTGRMLNSGSDATTHNTAAWTNFSQPCATANPSNTVPLVCSGGNPWTITLGANIGTTGGTDVPILSALRNCFDPETRIEPMNMTLPVIDCPANNPGNCSKVLGVVNVDIIWVSEKDADTESEFEKENFPPSKMGLWSCPAGKTRAQCWDHFVSYFNLKNVDGITATYAQKSMYFLPNCEFHELKGDTGGVNFGVLAKRPVLVK